MTESDLIKNITKDVAVELADVFDKNFENKRFFDDPEWTNRINTAAKGSLMAASGFLRRSLQRPESITDNTIHWHSSVPYGSIHNEGGVITVTDKMKKFFWAMSLKASGAVSKKKNGSASKSQRNIKLTAEAEMWKALALMKVGSKIKIPQRQFIGYHPSLATAVHEIIGENVQEYAAERAKEINNKIK